MDFEPIRTGSAELTDLAKSRQAEGLLRGLPVGSGAERPTSADIGKAAKEFEAYFVSYLLKAMRQTVPTGMIENKHGQQFYSFYDDEIGRLAAEAGGIGLKAMLEQSFDKTFGYGTTALSSPISRPIT